MLLFLFVDARRNSSSSVGDLLFVTEKNQKVMDEYRAGVFVRNQDIIDDAIYYPRANIANCCVTFHLGDAVKC